MCHNMPDMKVTFRAAETDFRSDSAAEQREHISILKTICLFVQWPASKHQ